MKILGIAISLVVVMTAMAQEPVPRPLPPHVKLAVAKVEPVMLPIQTPRIRREPVLPCAHIRTLSVDPQQDPAILVKPAPEAKGPMPVMKPMPRCGEP